MASAYDNVSKKLEQLHQNARQARQSEIITELLELVAAAKALGGERRSRATLLCRRRIGRAALAGLTPFFRA
jgi:hypothetical protein